MDSTIRTIETADEGLHGWSAERIAKTTDALSRILAVDSGVAAQPLTDEERNMLNLIYVDLFQLGMTRGVLGAATGEQREHEEYLRRQTMGGRAETGPLRIGSGDWAGYFMRGDNAFGTVMSILHALYVLKLMKMHRSEEVSLENSLYDPRIVLKGIAMGLISCNEDGEQREALIKDLEGRM